MVKLSNESADGVIPNLIEACEAMRSALYPIHHNARQRAMEVSDSTYRCCSRSSQAFQRTAVRNVVGLQPAMADRRPPTNRKGSVAAGISGYCI